MRIHLQKDDNIEVVLDIIFWKTAPADRRKINGQELIDTCCQVSRVMFSVQPMVLLCTAIAKQNPKDGYNKIVGKKIALAKAIAEIAFLNRIPPLLQHSQESHNINIQRRTMRQHIWNAFHQTFGRWN